MSRFVKIEWIFGDPNEAGKFVSTGWINNRGHCYVADRHDLCKCWRLCDTARSEQSRVGVVDNESVIVVGQQTASSINRIE